MIVVDSSVWISWFRRINSEPVQRLRFCMGEVLVGDLMLLEVLQGADDDTHAARLERTMRVFPVVAIVDEAIATQAAGNFRLLRRNGITIRKTIDLLIGTYCIAHGHQLLQDDRDFGPMVTHLGLSAL